LTSLDPALGRSEGGKFSGKTLNDLMLKGEGGSMDGLRAALDVTPGGPIDRVWACQAAVNEPSCNRCVFVTVDP
jgi:hypothetical protein